MTKDQKFYSLVHAKLFKTGSCKPNVWQYMKIEMDGKVAAFEVMYPSRGNIKLRKPKRLKFIQEGIEYWEFDVFRFTNKKELVEEKYILVDEKLITA
ncbi:hypothetical protein MZM54_00520 [[Brevibacterium] frigoritolerans]|nr:hypothetical protein [Peribacillus frigoritolerans]